MEVHDKILVINIACRFKTIQLFQLRLSRRKGKRLNMSAKGLSGKTSFIPEYITIHRFSTKFKLDLAFL